MADPVTDRKDIRVLIPRVRRAVIGPYGSGFVQTDLNDSDATAVIADAIGDVILYSGSVFGKELQVTARDDFYQAPTAWQTSEELNDIETAIMVAQAALTWFMRVLTEFKTMQRIRRADEEWEYQTSASALAERIKELRAARDAAIERLEIGEGQDAWVNTLLIRDRYTDTLIEPWVAGGIGGQLEIANPDYRFGGVEWLGG